MRDSEIVAAIVGGNPDGLATAYDKYAAPLYAYCRALLHEPADAADAVQDTFVIAASRLAGLRDRERLRPWLYAVARNESRRRIRARSTTSALEEAPEVTDEQADVGSGAEQAELRALMRAAVLGLNPAEQEVIELQLRQGLDGSEVADVLGVSRNHAHALISRARTQMEICLGVLLVARTGRDACEALNTLLEGWDGQLTALLRKRLNRHVERCPVCSEGKRRALRPAMLLGLAPLAALPATAAAPAGLRDQVLKLASSSQPEAVAHRATVATRTGSFGQHGFPKPLDPPKAHWWLARPAQLAAGASVAAAVIAVAAVVIAGGNGPHNTPAAAPGAISTSAGPSPQPGTSSGTSRPGSPGARGRPGSRAASGAPGQPGLIAPLATVSSAGSSGPGGSSSSGPSSGGSSPGASPPGSRAPSPPPTSRPPTTPAPSTRPPTTPPPPPPPPGTLTVSARCPAPTSRSPPWAAQCPGRFPSSRACSAG
jgi:RNA polymerase sigma factor (sigma-70 family)